MRLRKAAKNSTLERELKYGTPNSVAYCKQNILQKGPQSSVRSSDVDSPKRQKNSLNSF
jgi:hypothetical protein